MEKENRAPKKKQGLEYEIITDKKNGVYLSKDIYHDNFKSLNLLTKEAQESHKSFVDTLKVLEKQPENQMSNNSTLIEV